MKKNILTLLVGVFFSQLTFSQALNKYYVSVNGSDNGSGSVSSPFKTPNKALAVIKSQKGSHISSQVILRGGTYVLSEPLVFKSDDFGDVSSSVEFMSYPGEKAIISGGEALSGNWVKTNTPGVWSLNVGQNKFFQSLYSNNVRLAKASSDTLYSKGPIPQYASLYKVFDFAAINRLAKDSLPVFCGFQYSGNDFDNIQDLDNVEVIVYNSWDASWHRIYKIDKQNKIVYFKNPATYPVGFFSPNVRYLIENAREYLNKPGQWYLDSGNGKLYYYASAGQNPNNMSFIAPELDVLVQGRGDYKSDNYVANVKFTNITFAYSKSTWGVNSIAQPNAARKYPWLDLKQGFSSNQAALDCGEAISLVACKNWSFQNCTFSHLGNYALAIKDYSSNNSVTNCTINDIGGGGILVGFNYTGFKTNAFPDSRSPAYNKILNCRISDVGIVFPAAVGIGIMQANHTSVIHNTIYNLPYSGISVGWTFSASQQDNYTSYNTISYNHIYNVLRILTDGGGIYTLGRQTGSVYAGNYIHNVYRPKSALGAQSNGFFFDQGSSGFRVDSNVVESVKNDYIRFNQTSAQNINMGKNAFDKAKGNPALMQVIRKKMQ